MGREISEGGRGAAFAFLGEQWRLPFSVYGGGSLRKPVHRDISRRRFVRNLRANYPRGVHIPRGTASEYQLSRPPSDAMGEAVGDHLLL